MKILVVGDLHGRKPMIKSKDFDCIVLVGDICGDKEIAPIYKKYFKYLKENEIDEISFEDFAVLEFLKNESFESLEKRSLKVGHELMKYFDSFNVPVFMVAGNWDQSYGLTKIKDLEKNSYNYSKAFYDWYLGDKINPELIRGLKNIRNCMYQVQGFNGLNFIGYGLSSGPEDLEKKNVLLEEISLKQFESLKKSERKIRNKLSKAYAGRKNKTNLTFFITHNIPYGTKLDIVLDKDSYAYKKHMGSTVARDFCLKFKPMICVGGHIHEQKGKDKIGKTIVVNAGFGKDALVMVDFDVGKGRVKKVEFVGVVR